MSERESSFFAELKRRNVFRVALTYAVVAWLLIEIAAVFLPMFDAPEWIITAFLVLLALGFAVALFISWAFEMTPEGLKRTEELSPDEVIPYWSRRKFARFIIGMAVVAFGLSAYQLLVPKQRSHAFKHRAEFDFGAIHCRFAVGKCGLYAPGGANSS